MSYQLSFRPEVIDDLAQACDWYGVRAPDVAERFLEDYDTILEFIRHSAESHRVQLRKFRRVLFKHFPFAVWYELDGRAAVILFVSDCRQNPRKLRRVLRAR